MDRLTTRFRPGPGHADRRRIPGGGRRHTRLFLSGIVGGVVVLGGACLTDPTIDSLEGPWTMHIVDWVSIYTLSVSYGILESHRTTCAGEIPLTFVEASNGVPAEAIFADADSLCSTMLIEFEPPGTPYDTTFTTGGTPISGRWIASIEADRLTLYRPDSHRILSGTLSSSGGVLSVKDGIVSGSDATVGALSGSHSTSGSWTMTR